MESLDDVIDAMIAERVIHRHRRKWLIAIALVVVLALIVLATGGWKEKKGRTVPTLTAPVTVTSGKWEYNFTKAEIVQHPKKEYSPAEAELLVYFDLKNMDDEQDTSDSLDGRLLRLVPGDGKDLVESNGATCRGQIGWVVVFGLPPVSCVTEFDVPPDFTADMVEIGVLGERFESDQGFLGANEDPYWQQPEADAVVQIKPTVVVDNGEKK
ncbi:hypothetical protein E0H75_04295 [Kribbella capetownensis]|uniref:DUF4352 domain-containing protein n=1 Tax=Kribbella capetownensis TaxID=1572659 RepID=A0A4R0K563_9ACTN|nr:hypothetical protein [Kribbella capetownensis]TCC52968.1 hypothetical protein E0H75_04295 [Kribbella capetownensis]